MSATTEAAAPNPADFSVDKREGQYEAIFCVQGEVRVRIDATSLEEAREKAVAMCEEEDFGLELDEASSVDVDWVRKDLPMFRVMRGGRAMRVSHLAPGDLPREPDDRDF